MQAQHHLAQLNVAKPKAALDSPLLAEFVANLERINALAEAAPGFVWRLQDEQGDATAIRPFGADLIVNLSVWRDVAALRDYAFKSAHAEMLKKRRQWFERMEQAYAVLWWVPAGHRPTVTEAAQKLEVFRHQGACAEAFSFKTPFPPPEAS